MKALAFAAACLTLAAAACGTADGPQSAGPVPSVRGARPAELPARPRSRPWAGRAGFIGVPPVGATPSSPERGVLVLHFYGRSATHRGALVRVWVYADGRVIWDRREPSPEGVSRGFLEQRLTPEGVERLRSEVIASGLFGRRRTLAPHRDLYWGAAEARRDGRLVRLRWGHGPRWYGETTATPEQVEALRRVDALLTDPASALPSSAWADREIRAYVPSHVAVCLGTSPPRDVSRLLSLLPARAEELLRHRRWTRTEGKALGGGGRLRIVVLGRRVAYCSKAATGEAREVAGALSGLDRWHPTGPSHAYLVAEGVHNWEITTLRFEPYFPHGRLTPGR